jgi:HK97 family phage prohead protease
MPAIKQSESKVIECAFALKELTETGQFEGHAAVFGNVDLQGDRIKRGAFAETIAESAGRWPVLFGHNTGRVVGFSTTAEEDTKGLRVEGEFTLSADEGRNAYATAKHAAGLGQKFGLSIGYGVREGGADYDADTGIRTLKNLTVYEFSLAAIPANPRARIAHVKDLDACRTVRDVERILCSLGLSDTEAKHLISLCKGQRDADSRDALEREAEERQARIESELFADVRMLNLHCELKRIGVI